MEGIRFQIINEEGRKTAKNCLNWLYPRTFRTIEFDKEAAMKGFWIKRFWAPVLVCFFFGSAADGAEKIRIAVTNYNITYLSAAVAAKKGFFRDEGLDPDLIVVRSNVSISALVSGHIDYTMVFSAVVRAAIRGAPVRVVATFIDSPTYVMIGRPGIATVKDLRNGKIAVGSYGSSGHLVAQLIMKHFGIDPDKEVKIVALGDDGARLTALNGGVVDGALVAPPSDSEGIKMGFNMLVRANEIVKFPYMGLGTTVKKIADRPDQVKKVLMALIKANQFMVKNRDDTIQILAEWAKTDKQNAAAAYDAIRKGFSPDGTIPEDGLRLVIEQAKEDAKITRTITLNEVSDLKPLREAQKDLGINY
jgi:NitT/TauT family transport system substrate-binding protein